jgi:8-oxo-dGTP diphosphatase
MHLDTNKKQVYGMIKRLYPSQPIVGVGAVILRNGKILLGKRLYEPAAGKWSIPGGLVELGETLEHAVIREAKEETCLDVFNPTLFDVIDILEADKQGKIVYHYIIVDYLVIPTGNCEPTAASDTSELRWVPLNEVENYTLTGSFRIFFNRNRKRLEKAAL